MPQSTKPIEQLYREAIDAMTPAERFGRGQALFNWARDCMARQVVAERNAAGEQEPIDPYLLKLLVGRKMYQNETQVCQWIDRMVADVSP